MKSITKTAFVDLLYGAGITENQMQLMHASFEQQYPEAHEAFLAYLGADTSEILQIRDWAKQPQINPEA